MRQAMNKHGLTLLCVVSAIICLISGPAPWLAGKLFGPADASQNQLSSPTTGTVSGLGLTNNFNNALDSLNTMNSGASAPTNQLTGTPSQFNRWCNTTANPYPCNVYDGAQWLAPYYVDATNHLILNQIGGGTATIASAGTVDLCSVPQARITITGTTTITSFGSSCPNGVIKIVTFAGALTLTYNGTSLIVPGAANVVTSAGDQAVVQSLGSGNATVVAYTPANGQALLNPAVDVGTYVWTSAFTVPSAKYQLGFGQAVSRSTFATLFNAITLTQSVTATSGSPTLTGFSDTTQIPVGAHIEATFLPSNTAVLSCTSSTCLLNKNATASTTGNVTVFPYGDGDGSTTFNLPNCAGVILAGRDNMGGTARGFLTASVFGSNQSIVPNSSPDALGAVGGTQSLSLAQNQLPNVSPTGSFSGAAQDLNTILASTGRVMTNTGGATTAATPGGLSLGESNVPSNYTPSGSVTVGSINGNVTQQATPTIQPTLTANCMIRVLSMRAPLPLDRPLDAANDNQFAALESRLTVAA